MKDKIKLVFLIGSGRSGSTLIDQIVNINPNIIGVGELSNWKPEIFQEYCACGEIVNSCPFWSEVIAKVGWSESDYQKYREYQLEFDAPKRGFVFKINNHDSTPRFKDFISKNDEIFKAISEMAGNRIIFDSSKSPQRAFNLAQSDNLDVKLIHLMRDSRGVVWSYKKSFKKNEKAGLQKDMKATSLLKAIYSWLATNSRAFSTIKYAKVPSISIKYEDFCANPDDEIERILEFVLDDKPKQKMNLSDSLTTESHTIAGNRLRMKKDIVIRPDFAWKNNLTILQKAFTYLLTFPILIKFNAASSK